MIEINGLIKYYSNNKVLDNINLQIEKGKIFGLIGESGCGKSTLLRCINGLEEFQDGEIIIDYARLNDLNKHKLRELKKEIGMVFQNYSLVPQMTVFDNVALPMKCWKYPKKEIKEKVLELVKLVGLISKLEEYPNSLSGGQKQRIAIARALTLNPSLLLCDEATSALDPDMSKSILDLLINLNTERNITIILVSHQMEVIKYACHKVAKMKDGQILNVGSLENFIYNEAIKSVIDDYDADKGSVGCLVSLSKDDNFNNLWDFVVNNLENPPILLKKDTEVYKNNDLAYFIFLLNTDEEIALAKLFNSKEINYRFFNFTSESSDIW